MRKHTGYCFCATLGLLSAVGQSAVGAEPPAINVPLVRIQANSSVMDLTLRQTGKIFTLVDGVSLDHFPGKQSFYFINGQYYGHDLNDFHPLAGTRMSIMKLLLPPGENPLEFWRILPSAKANAVVFVPSAGGNATAKRDPSRNALPGWYEDKTEYRPTKFAPKFTLIESKVNASLLKRSDATWEDALGRAGMTHVEAEHVVVNSPYDPNQGKRYGLPSTHVFDFTGKTRGEDLTRNEVRQVAEGFGPFGLLGDQFGEGNAGFQSDTDQAFWFYERAREIAGDARCKWPTVFFGTYGGFEFYNVRAWQDPYGGNLPPDDARFKKYYDTPALAVQSCSYFNRMFQVTDANVSWYPQSFGYASDFYQRIHSIQVMKLGQAQKAPQRRTFLFWWYGIECVDNGEIHNGYHWEHETTSPPGKSIGEEHPVVDLNTAIGLCLIGGFVVGDGVIGWDNNIQFDPDPNTVGRDERWTAVGDDKNVRRAEHYGYPTSPVSLLSAQFIASQWYQTCSRTTGSPWKYARYKVDNGAWVEPEANGSTILKRAADGERNRQGVALARQRGKAVDWVFQNPMWLPSEQHSVTVEVGGGRWAQVVRGNEVVLCNETV
ncbi:hypothetical protein IAD21_03363 [Abditibacteriota bacterium]|nr:hypothetical protein IAD21_03363 [Abditibacteriota bacterium]